MEKEQDYLRDLAEIRSMMERSTKFLSLSGWAGIMAGIYALAGAFIAWRFFNFNPSQIAYTSAEIENLFPGLSNLILMAVVILILAVGTAIILSNRKANQKGESGWNAASRRLIFNMAVPLFTGGVLILILLLKGLIGLIAPFTLIFYGLALYNAGKFTYDEVKVLGMVQMGLGLIGSYFVETGLLLWAVGFGVVHIIYGIYMHFRYER
jgi:hypothetical protein